MKSRPFHSKFFSDAYVQSLSLAERWLYTYYCFNEHVNWLGTYEATDRTVLYEVGDGITKKELTDAKSKFESDNKMKFHGVWVVLVNSEKYDTHMSNIQLMASALKQFKALPDEVKNVFLATKPKSVLSVYKDYFSKLDYSLQVAYGVGYSVAEGQRQGEEIKRKLLIPKTKQIDNTALIAECSKFLQEFNAIRKTTFTSTTGFVDNYIFWRSEYSYDDLVKAVKGSLMSSYWKDKDFTPVLLFRQKNPEGEKVDRIGELRSVYREPKVQAPKVFEREADPPASEETRKKVFQDLAAKLSMK